MLIPEHSGMAEQTKEAEMRSKSQDRKNQTEEPLEL